MGKEGLKGCSGHRGVPNNLVASTLWHKPTALTPLRGLIEDIQRAILDFFWSGKHWIHAAGLYLPVAEGAQGLISIQSTKTLRLCPKLLRHGSLAAEKS